MTSTLSASAGASPDVAKIVRTVGTATKTRIAAGARVQAISISVWPCVGWGAGRPSRWRKRIRVTTSRVSTTRNTPAAHQKIPVKSWSIAEPKSDRGSSVVCGNGPPQPATHSATVSSQSRYRGTASRALGVGHGQRPGTLAGASPDVNEARLHPCEHPRPPASSPRNGVPPGAGARRRWDEPRVPRRGDAAEPARGGQGPAARARRGDQRRAVPSRDPAGGLAAAPTHRAAARGRRRGRPVLLPNALSGGESLRTRLSRDRQLPVRDAVHTLREVADALDYAHARGVVHRDIKPDNVLIADHHALVTDFGVAKALSRSGGDSGLTSVGVALGTPAYMAPEQAAGDPNIDHRADVYALGAMAYEMLAGRPPFTNLSPHQMLAAHVTERVPPITAHRPDLPPALAELVMRCLDKDPAKRPQTAAEVRDAP